WTRLYSIPSLLCRGVDRHERDLDPHREELASATSQVPDVHVPTVLAWGHDRVEARLGQGDADRAGERLDRDLDPGRELRLALGEIPDLQDRLGELVGQESESGDDRGPAPLGAAKVEDLHLQHVAGSRPLDVDRAGDRVDAGEVDRP